MLIGELECKITWSVAFIYYYSFYLVVTQIDIHKKEGSLFNLFLI
jgi:hypothetical protein